MPIQEKYGVLLLGGLRTHQENYALGFAADPRCRLIAVSDEPDAPSERIELNRGLAEELGIPYLRNLGEALARDDVHIVSVCVETERRGRVAVQCAQAGKHLYLDKPLAKTVEDAQAIVAAIKRAGVRSQMFSNVYSRWAGAARRALDGGEIGELRAIHCDVLFGKGNAGTAPVGRKRIEKPAVERYTFVEAKREMFDIGVYAVTMVNWLSRKSVKSVFGTTVNYFFEEHLSCDIEDLGALVLTLDDSVTATVSGGRIGWMSRGVQCLHLVGTRGVLTFDAWQPRLEIFADEPPFQPPPPPSVDPMSMWRSTQEDKPLPKRPWIPFAVERTQHYDARAFVDCIQAEAESEMNAEMAAQSIAVISAGYRSAASGQVVVLS